MHDLTFHVAPSRILMGPKCIFHQNIQWLSFSLDFFPPYTFCGVDSAASLILLILKDMYIYNIYDIHIMAPLATWKK